MRQVNKRVMLENKMLAVKEACILETVSPVMNESRELSTLSIITIIQ